MIRLLLLALIRLYQLTLSPLLGQHCRFEPSCSRYAAACIAQHGAARGSVLTLRRLLRCHPFNAGGYDPPPPSARAAHNAHALAQPRSESPCNTECRAHPGPARAHTHTLRSSG